ncbi:MAG: tetratricopeptide repeat protein [Gemmataceae bacterium]|nr:tetratricopeptide repeat protein [Gemmataceae bacterium]
MDKRAMNRKIEDLFERSEFDQARKLIEKERKKAPDNHWLITQLGVADYEQHRYQDALKLFLRSLQMVPDCPLTLWNLAGTLDSLGKHRAAIQLYTWLLKNKTSPRRDPCWESKEWADALKADCVYRMGVCFQRLKKLETAEECYKQYLTLLCAGIVGSYSVEDVHRQMQPLRGQTDAAHVDRALRAAVESTLRASGGEAGNGSSPPNVAELLEQTV